MSVSISDVEKTAYLARLEFNEGEKHALQEQLNQIVTYVEKLNELDTDNVEPTLHVLDIRNVFRDDVARPSMSQDEVLMNAPRRKKGYFSVPKVIG